MQEDARSQKSQGLLEERQNPSRSIQDRNRRGKVLECDRRLLEHIHDNFRGKSRVCEECTATTVVNDLLGKHWLPS